MIARFGPVSGYISQLILGFGIGVSALGSGEGAGASMGKLDFSQPATSGLIAALQSF